MRLSSPIRADGEASHNGHRRRLRGVTLFRLAGGFLRGPSLHLRRHRFWRLEPLRSALISGLADGLVVLMRGDLERVLFDEPAIHRRLEDIAAQISNDYRDRELTVIAVLHGSLMFVADLLRRIPLRLKLDCLSAASYHGKTETSGEVIFRFAPVSPCDGAQVMLSNVAGRDVLIVDDILDSGHTLAAVRETLQRGKPRSIRLCVLLTKKKQRVSEVDVDYVGFEIEDEFVVGYGLDFRERYRNLPYIGVLRKELLEEG
jgi:hypoxanthine phosphoribosyltransferase